MFYHLITLTGAVLLDLAFGDPPGIVHPVAWMGKTIAWGWRFRPSVQSAPLKQFAYGTGLVLLGTVLFGMPWTILLLLDLPLFWLWSIPLLKCTLAIRGLIRAGRLVLHTMETGDIESTRRLLSRHLVSRSTTDLSTPLVTAATVESLAENITDGVAAPLFYFSLFGLPGAWVYRFVNTCDSMLGYRDEEHEYAGKFAARLDTLLNWLPARITGLLIVAAAIPAGEDVPSAWRTMWSQHTRTASPNAGWTMAAAAGALGVTLEKVGHYRLEGGEEPLGPEIIDRCLNLLYWTALLVIVFSLLLAGGLYACFA